MNNPHPLFQHVPTMPPPPPASTDDRDRVGRIGTRDYSLNGHKVEEDKRNGTSRRTKLCARGHWRPAEDDKLKELVAHYGPQNWNLISENLRGRSGKSCRLRWFNQLDPRINRRTFNQEEEERLLTAHRLYGNKWAMIARLFPGRTDNAVKNHWHVIMARRHRQQHSILYRRSSRKPPPPPRSNVDEDLDVKPFPTNNVSSESTISSIVDESAASASASASTSTYLSLSASPPNFLMAHRARIEKWAKTEKVMAGGRLGSSESNSEDSGISTSLSLATGWENKSNGMKMEFIDFLGVGAS